MIGLVWATAAGRAGADRLVAAWPDEVHRYDGSPADMLPAAFAAADQVIAFVPVDTTIRLLAPHLRGKSVDAGVVCVDDAIQWAVALLGGHGGGANDLARRVAAVLGARPVVTTATDAVGLPSLDMLGWPVHGDVAAVSRAIVDGDPIHLVTDVSWPLPALPPNVGDHPAAAHVLVVSDRVDANISTYGRYVAVLRPPSLVVDVRPVPGVSAERIDALIDAVLAEAGLSELSVRRVTADATGTWRTGDADVSAGGTAEVLTTRREPDVADVSVTRLRPRGRLAIVGIGPGARDLLPARAVDELRRASVVVGLDQYLDQIRDLLRPGTRVLVSGLGQEDERARTAVDHARAGHAVALIGSGDAGVYAMASPALERGAEDIDVVGVPGITAALAAAAALGAPLGHDHAYISLSDLHTPWEVIERRIRAAAVGDFVVCFYNPRSRTRHWQLARALAILGEHRPADTPIGIVRDASRHGQRVTVTTWAAVDLEPIDMHTCVLVGASTTRLVDGRMVTPRGYRWSEQPPTGTGPRR